MTAAEETLQFQTTDGASHLAVMTAGNPATRLAVLFIPAAGQTRTGPERLHVRLAREWAQLGIASLRFDAADAGDDPLVSDAAMHADSASAAALALQERYPAAGIVVAGFGRAAIGAAQAAALLAEAGVRVHSLCLINPMLGDIPMPQPQSWWQRIRQIVCDCDARTSAASAPAQDRAGDDAAVWRSLPSLLQQQNMRLLVITGGGERAYATLETLAERDRAWRRALRNGSTLRLDGVDRYLMRPAHWQVVNGWFQRQLAG